jgi:hypothetical protein
VITRHLVAALAAALAVVALVLAVARDTLAQQKPPETKAGAAATKSAPASPPGEMPISIEQALYLIRSTLLTLNDANRTGNYTVLRDLAAPDFQARNNAADLALSFSDLRRRNFDLFGAALLAPQLTAAPALDAEKRLRLTGFFPTRPLQINFDLLFEVVAGQWRLYGVSIATPEATPPPPQAQAPAAKQEMPASKNP